MTDLTLKTSNYSIFHDVIRVNVGQELSGIVDRLKAPDMPFREMLQATKFVWTWSECKGDHLSKPLESQ